MGLALNSQTKKVIYNVYQFFRKRKQDPASNEHRDDVNLYKTVAAAVGVSRRSIMRVVKEGDALRAEHGEVVFTDPKHTRKVDLDTAIRAKFLEFIKRKERPTVNKIRIELLEDGVLLCSYDYMKLQLKRLGYRFRPARPRRLHKKVGASSPEPSDEDDGARSSGGQLEHVTVKLEPLEPGCDYHLTTSTASDDQLECDIRIKVERDELDDVD